MMLITIVLNISRPQSNKAAIRFATQTIQDSCNGMLLPSYVLPRAMADASSRGYRNTVQLHMIARIFHIIYTCM